MDDCIIHQSALQGSLELVHQISLCQGFRKGFDGGASGLLVAEKSMRLKELDILLNMDERDTALLDDSPEEVKEKSRSKDMER